MTDKQGRAPAAPAAPAAPLTGAPLFETAQQASNADTALFNASRRAAGVDLLVARAEVRLVALAQCPQFVPASIDLLNSQWPKSERKIKADTTAGSLPCHLAMVSGNAVIGHGALVAVAESHLRTHCVILESITVCSSRRGQGYGKLLMELIEGYCRNAGFTSTYLWTRDKINFYSAVGYQLCDPVTPMTARIAALSEDQLEALKRLGSTGGKYLWMTKAL